MTASAMASIAMLRAIAIGTKPRLYKLSTSWQARVYVTPLDYSARVLIEFVLGEAAALSKGVVRNWIDAARGTVAEDADIETLQRLIRISDGNNNTPPGDAEREMLEARLKRLIAFHGLNASIIVSLQKTLAEKGKAPSKRTPKKKAKKTPSKKKALKKRTRIVGTLGRPKNARSR
jgi:hypothetical protein